MIKAIYGEINYIIWIPINGYIIAKKKGLIFYKDIDESYHAEKRICFQYGLCVSKLSFEKWFVSIKHKKVT